MSIRTTRDDGCSHEPRRELNTTNDEKPPTSARLGALSCGLLGGFDVLGVGKRISEPGEAARNDAEDDPRWANVPADPGCRNQVFLDEESVDVLECRIAASGCCRIRSVFRVPCPLPF